MHLALYIKKWSLEKQDYAQLAKIHTNLGEDITVMISELCDISGSDKRGSVEMRQALKDGKLVLKQDWFERYTRMKQAYEILSAVKACSEAKNKRYLLQRVYRRAIQKALKIVAYDDLKRVMLANPHSWVIKHSVLDVLKLIGQHIPLDMAKLGAGNKGGGYRSCE